MPLWKRLLDSSAVVTTSECQNRHPAHAPTGSRLQSIRVKEEREGKMLDMWLRCYSNQEIADAIGIAERTIQEFLEKSAKKYQEEHSALFRDFEPELYSVWNFAKATNEVRHFGNIPPEIIDNLLYYYTQPGDVVFDPFGGGV